MFVNSFLASVCRTEEVTYVSLELAANALTAIVPIMAKAITNDKIKLIILLFIVNNLLNLSENKTEVFLK